jgi:hypothetical protein
MRDLTNLNADGAKAAAARMRTRLRELGVDVSHGQTLEAIAAVVGDPSWNVTAARLTGSSADTSDERDGNIVPVLWFDIDEAQETIAGVFPDITREETRLLLEAYVADRTPAKFAKKGHWNADDHDDIYRTTLMEVWLEEVFLAEERKDEPEELSRLRTRMSAPRPI